MADHTTVGHQIVSTVQFPWPKIPEAVRWHHERNDGSGYPDKLGLIFNVPPRTAKEQPNYDLFSGVDVAVESSGTAGLGMVGVPRLRAGSLVATPWAGQQPGNQTIVVDKSH
jgi:hypothetical protein